MSFSCLALATFSSEKHDSKRNFKKFKPFKKLKWQKLQEHDYKEMAPMKAHKFKQSRKGTSYEGSASLIDGNKAANKYAAAKSKVSEVIITDYEDYHNRGPNLKSHVSNIAKAMNRQRKKNLLGGLADALQNAVFIESHVQSQALKSVITSQSSSRRGLLDALRGANISTENSAHNEAVKSKILKQTKLPKRGLFDALSGANISIENSVHNQAVKSKVMKQTKIPRRGLLDALSGANISIENSVHNQAVKSKVMKQTKIPRRGLLDALSGANISIENSVHNQAVKSKVMKQTKIPKRGLLDALSGANISIENSVHNQAVKSKVMKQTNIPRRGLLDVLSGANISIENSVHNQAVKSKVLRQNKLPKRGLLNTLKGANIPIENSVHNQAVKSKVHNKPSKPQIRVPLRRRGMSDILKNADVSIQNSVYNYIVARRYTHGKHAIAILGEALKNPNYSSGNSGHSYPAKSEIDRKTKRVDVAAQKRDEEPFSDSKGVQLHGNSAMEVAGSVQLFLKYLKQFNFCISKYL